jgi:branched-chain amino acid transport system substrate-binding protein
LIAAVTAATLAPALAAGPAAARKQPRADGALTIGDLAPDTGELSPIVQSLRVPVQLAVQEINDAGGVNGKPVGLVNGDDATPELAAASLQTMIDTDHVDALIGPSTSPVALQVLPRIRKARILTCSGSNTSDELSSARRGGYYFRTAPPDELQGRALAQLVVGDRHRKVALLVSHDPYGTRFRRVLHRSLAEGGVKLVADLTYAIGDAPVERSVKKIVKRKPQAIVVVGSVADGAKVVRALIAAGLGPQAVPIYTTDGIESASFAATVNAADRSTVAGIKGTTPAAAPAGVESPFDARLAATGTELIFSTYHYYDCTILTALAAVKAKTDDPTKMKRAFAANLKGKKSCATFADCTKLLQRGRSIHWRGASSRFDRFGGFQPAEGVYDVWTYDAAGKVQTMDSSAQVRVRE